MVIQGVTYLSDFEAKKAIMEMARRPAGRVGDRCRCRQGRAHAGYAGARGYEWQGDAQRKAQAPARRPAHPSENLSGKRERPVRDAHLSGLRGCDGDAGPDRAACSVRALGRVQLLPAQNVDAQAQAVSLLCRTDKAVLLENDGCLTWGKTPADAAHLVEALDYYAAVTAKLGCAGCSKCGSCGGHCTGCSKCGAPAVQPMAQPAAQPVAMAVPSAQPAQPVSLPGVTGLIQPGMALPTLPKQQAAPAPVPAAQPAAVPAMEAAPAAPKSANARDAAMAEVIRRTLKSFQ